MTPATTRKPVCGARRPSGTSPCVLDPFHRGGHVNKAGEGWPRVGPVYCARCRGEAVSPVPGGHQEAPAGPGVTAWVCSPNCR